MCQQWFSIVGLVSDVVGFLMIAREWYKAMAFYRFTRELEISEIRARSLARWEGKTRTPYEEDEDNPSLPKHMEAALENELADRTGLFWWGMLLVIIGFLLQVIGSWPGGAPLLGIKSC
jgi:hypothetical protein